MKGLLHIFTVLAISLYPVFASAQDSVFFWVDNGDVYRLAEYLKEHDINAGYGSSDTTLLVRSILYGRTSTCAWFIESGADVNRVTGGLSPLIYAAGTDDPKKMSLLINAGADIEFQDKKGNTALFYAAGNHNLKITKQLVKKGANLTHRNYGWEIPYDIAVRHRNPEVAKYLRAMYEKNLPDFRDGPYVRWRGKKRIHAFYIVHDSKSQITRRSGKRFRADSDPYLMSGFAGDSLDYLLHSRKEATPDLIESVDRVLVIGDIHGGYDSLVMFLRQNGIINNSLQWTWGKGHLVFIGDIFDRGDRVTEALWLIYRLEEQASGAGGAIHYILGNHEIMVLTGNTNYLSHKYHLLSSKLNLDYSMLFGKRTILGQWLRTKNTLMRINGHMFVHAGLSPDIIESGLEMSEINDHVRYFLNHPDKQQSGDVSRNMLFGNNGPFWYRGYIKGNHYYPHLPEDEFETVLSYFDAEYIFIGHTNVKQITPFYHNRVFALDVPFYTYGFPIQGLLLEDDVIYLLDSSAVKSRIR